MWATILWECATARLPTSRSIMLPKRAIRSKSGRPVRYLNARTSSRLPCTGDHRLGRGVEADWSLVWANATNDAPDRTYVVLENDRNNYVDKVRADHMERRWESNSDRDLSAAANFEWAYDEAFAPMSLKWGGLYRDKRRTNDYVSYLFTPMVSSIRAKISARLPTSSGNCRLRKVVWVRSITMPTNASVQPISCIVSATRCGMS